MMQNNDSNLPVMVGHTIGHSRHFGEKQSEGMSLQSFHKRLIRYWVVNPIVELAYKGMNIQHGFGRSLDCLGGCLRMENIQVLLRAKDSWPTKLKDFDLFAQQDSYHFVSDPPSN
ncbi:hypothetical protein M9H77_36164 [Catharanthus roseus]|uniref:Uncharacterized protein n=1 Tax=Catharanthus roseus TaxID=4058 RepID=A0ACB9ZSU3_CATRO|nr:hypothetical protein M9H77_36164 [Catharanthus roseus]